MLGGRKSLTKPICSICYEDLKPVIEDLQSISVCGHVFHELCLQQWFEYCPNAKKRCCPVCKRPCANEAAVGRLFFQSVSDPNDTSNPLQNPSENENRDTSGEVSRLEWKLLSCKEQLKEEVALKNEAMTTISTNQELLCIKSQELNKSTSECTRLREKNMALAKELAAVKLASDVVLEEDEVMKLASLGNEVGSSETVDVLRKSLVLRNKSYKELMAKCSVLGRGEARCRQKLEKANEKIRKLKMTVQELEAAIEVTDNAALRALTESHAKRPKVHIDLDDDTAMDQEECASMPPPPPIERKNRLFTIVTAKKIDVRNDTGSSPG
ncbi:hypothetical protein M569_10675 [Genlisea aurea]|uniref:RING-type domain-containing protein n=1 Tax=Genlisea aurea TaxID=192259 RepID=S8DM87_9LAMI|nr:hypothetical protein M569_10675 [Genlisea aurea]